MIASVLLTMIGASLVSAFIQNARMARAVMMRTAATAVAIGVSEQIRSYAYDDFSQVHFAPGTATLGLRVYDPTDTASAGGMRLVQMPLNVTDGTTVNSTPTSVTMPVILSENGTQTRVPLPMEFWIESRNRVPKILCDDDGKPVLDDDGKTQVVDRCQVFEIALVYRWKNPNYSDTKWHSGVIRIVTPNTDMNAADAVSGS